MCWRSDNSRLISTERHAITASDGSIKAANVPAKARILLYDVEHIVDLDACRRRMPYRVAELLSSGAEGGGQAVIAAAADIDPKTLRTFLDSGRVSAESMIAIIERGLGLKFADIVTPARVA